MFRVSRLSLLNIVAVVAFLVLAGKLWQLQITEGDKYRGLADRNSVRVRTVEAARGVIYDRNMGLLVGNKPSWTVNITPADLPEDDKEREEVFSLLETYIGRTEVIAIIPSEIPEPAIPNVVATLSRILQMPEEDVRAKIEANRESETEVVLKDEAPPEMGAAARETQKILPGVVVKGRAEFLADRGVFQPFTPVVVKANVPRDTALLIDANHIHLPGVSLGREPVRQYLEGPLFSHLIGYVGRISQEQYDDAKAHLGDDAMPVYEPDDMVGQTGLELSFEDQLRGKKGGETVLVSPDQRVIEVLSNIDPVPGNSLVLTIDAEFQRATTEALQKQLDRASQGLGTPVRSGVALAMNPKTGEIYSMVSLPSFDNNLFAEGISAEDYNRLQSDEENPLVNKTISGLYPPGSTFKLFVAAGALQEGVINTATKFFCPGRIDVAHTWGTGTSPFYCWEHSGHGLEDVIGAIRDSCDVFFYNIAAPGANATSEEDLLRYYNPGSRDPQVFRGMGIEKVNEYATKFGLAQSTGIDLPGELKGVIPGPEWKAETFEGEVWNLGDTLNTGIGQGYDLVTPLELLSGVSAIANGGTVYKPQIVQKVIDSDGNTVKEYTPQASGKVPVSEENMAIVREGMRQVVTEKGTAYRIAYPDLTIAGKTGTAEYGPRDAAGNRRSHAWFTAFAPADDPQIAVVVMLAGGGEGSTYAVPAAGEMLRAFFDLPPIEK